MKKQELIKQLHNLKKEIKPDLKWQKSNREILLSQIKSQTTAEFSFSHQLLFKNLFLAVYKPLGAMILIMGILFGSWIASVGATRNSLPGDFLYGFKLTAERMQVNLALSEEKKTDLEIEFAERRLDEIKKTAGKEDTQKNKKNLEVTLKKFQESINNVKSNLAKLEITDKQSAIKVAKLVDEKTQAYAGILQDQQGQDSNLAANKETAEAINISKSTSDKALSVILKEFEAGDSGLYVDDVKKKVEDRISNLEKNIASAQGDIEKIIANKKIAEELAAAKVAAEKKAAEEAAAAKAAAEKKAAEEEVAAKALADKEAAKTAVENPAPAEEKTTTEIKAPENPINTNTNTNNDNNNNTNASVAPAENNNTDEQNNEPEPAEEVIEEPVEVLPTIDEIKDKPKEAASLLAKARGFLQSASVSQAFELVRQADDIMTLVNKVIKANEQYLEAPKVEVENGADVKTTESEGKKEE